MSDSAGPSTPSRKRSRWDADDESEQPIQPQLVAKRRTKSKVPKSPEPTSQRAETPKRSQLSAERTRPSHSIYVPLGHTTHPCFPLAPARDKETGDIVALKKLKLEEEKHGFPITALREINALMVCKHENVVGIREVVVGDTLTQVFIVMDFIEHDLKTLLTVMPSPFLQSEIKTLMLQLLSAVAHCHERWILHRDLKTSNLLMNNRGTIKVADFGLARRYGDPVGVGGLTQLVVTLWYRAPEILLGATTYSTAVDMWSVGCIFAELLLNEPLFQAKGEIELLSMIFKLLDDQSPTTTSTTIRQKFQYITAAGIDLMSRLLTYDPERRISAEEALKHPYFSESPFPKHPDLFGSFPSAAAGEKRRKPFDSPSAPVRAVDYKLLTDFDP
ncbi:Cyclin-dependent kinase 11B [Grifola frondosa]|uniref:Cyclin-dependent kinase 11B n=1 Tax=Grifola frondosa TaxID=5627 RepID=A0A1C7MQ44_GRIFR|nr:Cyclin-dependent kinase 11B [Grifola frondosa]